MSRQRFIYPELFRNEQVAALSDKARWLYAGCIATADDDGRRKASPGSLKADIFPLDDIPLTEIEVLRDEVAAQELIRLYYGTNHPGVGAESVLILDLPTWHIYQRPKYRKASKFPPYPGDSAYSGTNCPGSGPIQPGVGDKPGPIGATGRVGLGREGSGTVTDPDPDQNGPEPKPTKKRRVRKDDHGRIVQAFCDAFKEVTSKDYPFSGKDAKLIKEMLQQIAVDELLEYIKTFFTVEDEFVKTAGFSVGVLKGCLPKLVQGTFGQQRPKSLDERRSEDAAKKYGPMPDFPSTPKKTGDPFEGV